MPYDKTDHLFMDETLKADVSLTGAPLIDNLHLIKTEIEAGKKGKENTKNENEENVSKMR